MRRKFIRRGGNDASASAVPATRIGAITRSFIRSFGAGLAALAVATATVVLAPGAADATSGPVAAGAVASPAQAAAAAGTITITTFSVPIRNWNSATFLNICVRGTAVHDLTTERHEPDKPRGLRPDLWGTAG